jgi:hypothetical protein
MRAAFSEQHLQLRVSIQQLIDWASIADASFGGESHPSQFINKAE